MIIITGASGSLGSHLVKYMNPNHKVIGTYNHHRPNNQLAEYYQVDVSDANSIERFITAIGDQLHRIVLINMAGISLDRMGHKMSESIWTQVLDVNLKGTFLMCHALLPFMRKEEWGRIINISSIVAQRGIPGTVAYSASKGGIFSLTRTLAVENAMKGITVNALALGYFNAGMTKAINPDIQKQIQDTIPMKRFGHPKNLKSAVQFLIDCDYITGTTININGGLF